MGNIDINYDRLTRFLGDPFADVGGYVIDFLLKKEFPEKNISQLIEWATNIYVNKWGKKLHIFFLNHIITNPSTKNPYEKTIEYFEGMLNNDGSCGVHNCNITGEKTHCFYAGRDNYVLCGSGGMINFHPTHTRGLLCSKEVLIRLFFMPLGVKKLGGKAIIYHSNNEDVCRYFVERNVIDNIKLLASNSSNDVLSDRASDIKTSIFNAANDCLDAVNLYNSDNTHITIYHFTNSGQSADLSMYRFNDDLFLFNRFCNSQKYKGEWRKFLRSHFFKGKSVFDGDNILLNGISLEEGEYREWGNRIFQALLNDKSILSYIKNWSIKNKMSLKLIETYLTKLRKMENKTLQNIKIFVDFVFKQNDDDYLQKFIHKLKQISNKGELSRLIVRLISENYENGSNSALINVDDFVDCLFAESQYYAEIRDVFLVYIYQKMHETNSNSNS